MAESVCFVPSLRLRIIEIENHPYLSTLFSKEFGYTLAIFASGCPYPPNVGIGNLKEPYIDRCALPLCLLPELSENDANLLMLT